MRRPFVACLLAAAALSGCGGGGQKTNGEEGKTPAEIVADARAAVRSAPSVHVSGSGLSSGRPLRVDLRLVRGKGGKGRLTANGVTFDMIRVGTIAYFKAGPSFWRHFGVGTAVQLLQNRWLKASATSGQLATFTPLTDISALFDAILGSHGKLEKIGESTVGGIRVVGIRDTSAGGTLYVAITGKPYPVAIRKKGRGGLRFEAWGRPVTLQAPPGAVDLAKIAPH
jgi:hypothetical protein